MLEHYGTDTGMRMARKHMGWYSKGLFGSTDFRVAVNQTSDVAHLKELIHTFYDPLIQHHQGDV